MFFEGISYIAAIIATVVSTALGFVWYSPYLFGNRWIKEMGTTFDAIKERNMTKKGMAFVHSLGFIGTLLTAIILAAFFNTAFVVGISGLFLAGSLVWLGFMAPIMVNEVIYGGKSWMLFSINAGYQLVSLLIMSFIIGIFG